VKTLVSKIKEMPSLKVIVYTNDMVEPNDTKIEVPSLTNGVQILSFDEFVAMGDVEKYPVTPPSPQTSAVVMYTSGSTGKPKGVVITHANVVAAVAGPEYVLDIGPDERYIAYLPLAHILELVVEFVVLGVGASVNYADPRTLTSSGSYPMGALDLYKPTHMVGVPKIWDTIKKGVMDKLKRASPLQQAIAETALEWKAFCVSIGLDTPLFNALVLDKFKQGVGGELKWALSGGGPLSGESQIFARVAFGAPLVQAYGLTESTATVSLQRDDDMRSGVQGSPFPCCEIKLESTPEITDKGGIPYKSTDRKDVNGNPCWGRGEILIKGPNVTSGYYMQPEETKEVYLDGGWFATGDIGQFNQDGSLSIVDRKKNLVKLKSGEYVALEKMEIVYGGSDFVDALAGGVCVYADGDMDRPVALVELNKNQAMKWAKENGADLDIETLKVNKSLNKTVLDSLNALHAKSDLSHIEKLSGVALLTSPWTVENGCLTAANKLQRRNVIAQFPKEFEEVKQKGIFN
jgi:long-chain acyl-CoA synthetase